MSAEHTEVPVELVTNETSTSRSDHYRSELSAGSITKCGAVQDGVSLPSYRGDIINGPEFTEEARVPDPNRLVQAYNQSAATMNLLRAFSTGGYAGLNRIRDWKLAFMDNTPEGAKYLEVARRIDEAVQFMHVRAARLAFVLAHCSAAANIPCSARSLHVRHNACHQPRGPCCFSHGHSGLQA
jgi:3-deoxy-D-arabino-heptulosonate 7-phosphate (DAHP) synthase class II